MERQDTRRRLPSTKQVEVWLATVLNPMARALAVEQERVAKQNWTFRGHSADFEFLQSTRNMVTEVYLKNLEQAEDYLPALAKMARRHDTLLDDLRDVCRSTFEVILQTKGFLDETADNPDARRFVAEYLINSLGDLPGYYQLSAYWTEHRQALFDQRARDPLAKHFRTVSKAGAAFTHAVDDLHQEIDRLIAELADRHKLPRVSPID